MLVVVPVARCRGGGVDAPQKRGRQCQSSGGPGRAEERLREDAFLRVRIGFLVREVMSVPRRNAIMRSAADRQGGRYVNQSSIRRKDTDGNEKLS